MSTVIHLNCHELTITYICNVFDYPIMVTLLDLVIEPHCMSGWAVLHGYCLAAHV